MEFGVHLVGVDKGVGVPLAGGATYLAALGINPSNS